MSGRHLSAPSGPRPRWPLLVVATAVAGAGAVAGLVAVSGHDGGRGHAATTSRCAHPVNVAVTASPPIAPAISKIAAAWRSSTLSPAQRRCISVAITARDDATAEPVIASGAAAPDLWIPSSSIWTQRLTADLAGSGARAAVSGEGSVASSPVVLVDRPGAPATFDPAAVARSAASSAPPVLTPDPVTTAEGLLALTELQRAAASGAASRSAAQHTVALLVALNRATIDTTSAGFAQLAGSHPRPFWAAEQSVIAYNAHATKPATARYASAGNASLDYPAVLVRRAGADPLLTRTAGDFAQLLRAVTAQRILATDGFRDPQGNPIAGASGVGSAVVERMPLPPAHDTANMLRMWSAAAEASHTLTVIDVSGSMAQPAGNGQSKIEVATDAALGAVSYFADSSAFGLWAFSSDQASGRPWVQLGSLADLGTQIGGKTQRQRLIAAGKRLPSLVGGNTALYDTALAAFLQVRNTYDPGKVNSVVLLTDGMNEYPQGLSLDDLLVRLRSLVDPSRPVPVLTIGIGDHADLGALRQISAVTGGKTYVVRNPADVRGAFLDAMVQRECRPDCTSGS
jgi:Ca-activated chloride channel homolog